MMALLRAPGRPEWRLPARRCSRRSAAAPRRRPAGAPAAGQALVDPLSERELDVLRLLASDLDGPAIARELVVSLNTVRTHTKHIYTKLGVNNRRAAVSRAHQLGLLNRSGRAEDHHCSPHDATITHASLLACSYEPRAPSAGTKSAFRGASTHGGPPGSTA